MASSADGSWDGVPAPQVAVRGGVDSLVIERALLRFGELAKRAGAAHGLSGDDLDEVLQEVRLRLWRASATGGPARIAALKPSYVYRTAASAAIDILRRRRARREERLEEGQRSDATWRATNVATDAGVVSAETLRGIEQALEELAANRRAVVRMYLRGYGREEIADLLGWTEAKTRNLLYRGLDDLRRGLLARGIHP